jgi:MFS family permease
MGMFARWFGLKTTAVAALLLSTLMVIIFGWIGDDPRQLTLVAPVLGFFTAGGMIALYAIMSRVYPARLRATGIGFTLGAGRGGAALAPIAAGALFSAGFNLPIVSIAMGIGSILAAALLLPMKLDEAERA